MNNSKNVYKVVSLVETTSLFPRIGLKTKIIFLILAILFFLWLLSNHYQIIFGILFLIFLVGLVFFISKPTFYKNLKNRKKIEKKLLFFLKSNSLFVEDFFENRQGEKEKYIKNSACVGYLDTESALLIRAYKDGDSFTEKMSSLETLLSALFRLPVVEKHESTGWCQYMLEKIPDTRLNLSNGIPQIKGTVIPITERIAYDVSKVSHGLTVGGTGSGKSFLINYKVLCYAQMRAEIFIADPKNADLSLIRFLPSFENRVATEPNQIARLLREVSEIMEARYKTHFSDVSAFGKTFKDFSLCPVVFVFDELAAFMKTADKKIREEVVSHIFNIILKGRQAGVFMELILQRPDASILDGAIRDQLGCRVLLGNASTEARHMVFGSSEVEYRDIKEKGGGYIKVDGQGEEKYFEAPYLGKNFDFIGEMKKICERNA